MMRAFAVIVAVLALVAAAAVVGTLGSGAEGPEAATWTFGESMSQRRSYVAAAEIDGQVYAAGGMVGETGRPLDLLARYDPATDNWETLRRLPEAVRAGAAASVDGVLYVIGGTTAAGNSSAVYAYDPATDEWSERAPATRAALQPLGSRPRREDLCPRRLLEGEERQEVYVYDPATDRWSDGPPLPFANHAFDAVAFRGEIWMIGGRRGDEILRDARWLKDRLKDAPEAKNQIAFADVILLNKTDLVTKEELADVEARIRGINPYARLHRTQRSQIAIDEVLGRNAFDLDRILEIEPEFLHGDGHDHDHHHQTMITGTITTIITAG